MKNFRNVAVLSTVLFAIVFMWLIPKTQAGHKTKYVRTYTEERERIIEEHGGEKPSANSPTKKVPVKKKVIKERVIVQADTLDGSLKRKDMKMSLYSRSAHFKKYEKIEPPKVQKADTVGETMATKAGK
jgi:hypothetical protein